MTLDAYVGRYWTNEDEEPCRIGRDRREHNGRRAGLTVDGVTRSVREWAAVVGITRQTLNWRLRAGWPLREAVTKGRSR
jgi:hypothetical protein